MKRLVLSAILVLSLVGCSGSSIQNSAKQAVGVKATPATLTPITVPVHDCADKLANLFATNIAQGAWACLSPDFQFQLDVGAGVTDDATLSTFFAQGELYDASKWTKALPPGELAAVPVGETEEAYHLAPTAARGTPGYYKNGLGLKIFLDSSGQVVDIQAQ